MVIIYCCLFMFVYFFQVGNKKKRVLYNGIFGFLFVVSYFVGNIVMVGLYFV